MIMPEIARLNGPSNAIELNFVERVYTPRFAMRLGIHLHLAGLSLSKTVSILENFDVDRCRSTVHYWVKQSDLEPQDGRSPDKIALDETVVKIDGEQHWLFAAVDPETNLILHVGVYTARTTVATKLFLRELQDKHEIDDAEFFVDGAPWLQAGLFELGMHFRHETHGDRNPVERVFQEIKRRTDQFYNNFSNADPETVDSWLKALAFAQNQLV